MRQETSFSLCRETFFSCSRLTILYSTVLVHLIVNYFGILFFRISIVISTVSIIVMWLINILMLVFTHRLCVCPVLQQAAQHPAPQVVVVHVADACVGVKNEILSINCQDCKGDFIHRFLWNER